MVRNEYNRRLSTLKQNILNMGDTSQKVIIDSTKALRDLDLELADETIEMDNNIDDSAEDIEKSATHLLALQHPLAGDLRLIIASIKVATDLERISDLGINIAEIAKSIEGEHVKPLIDIPKMAEITEDMLQKSLQAFENLDVELAKEAAARDDEVDKLFYGTWMELINMMVEDPTLITNATHLLFVLRYLERIGDHVSNICESVVYIANGERVKLN
ncbi:phosphate uptake regulator, PhoU [Methanohalobium evestigatum Z-7303]|uniref:Phosphate-specific transport system accessory protein PhoU n=1 Tax=Methanohalobium evestigatum (strain ATCC BAA-1072 / DSM 3721 / NBRC 107634 / OCM 161 / Z-7303) TaxID=644295 RepID=D7EB62_METEZ|nr:phosphate signaling complex protein PhoU [Methanohalobium evestigatum]ADI74579.1 phosphate uptake regulator, PhoU [Methanohalobium evestigatum Z-7303]